MPELGAVEDHALGLSWVVDEPMARASHALLVDGRVWLVDPVDAGDALERAAGLGEPAGVLQLLDRHGRDCEAVARRLGVEHRRLPEELPGTPLRPFPLVTLPGWKEVAIWWPERAALVVAEAVATSAMHTGGASAVGVHLLLRPLPPSRLRRHAPEHLLVGHGPSLHGPAAAAALTEALDRSRRDLPKVLLRLPATMRR